MNLPTNNQFSNGLDVRQRSNPFWWMSRSEAMIWHDMTFSTKTMKNQEIIRKKTWKTYENIWTHGKYDVVDVFELMIDDTDVISFFFQFDFSDSEANSWSVGRMTSRRFFFPKRTGEGTEKEGTWHEGTGDMKDLKDMRLGEGSREVNRNGGNGWRLQVFWKILWCQNCFLVCRFILQQMFNLTESLQRQFQKNAWNSRNSPKGLRRWALRTISCWWRKSCLCIQMAWFAVPSLLTSRVPFTSNHGWWHHVWPSVETGQICITVTFLGDVICTGYHDVCMTVRWNLTMNVSFENVQVSHSTLTALHINSMTA